ncbi:hypothetical protein KY284_012860 [Solanum tuberosum]|nr:hypothetical protein KY284_012860 [Solanum tuberosum]
MNRGSIPLPFVFNYKMEGFRGLMGTNKNEDKVLILHGSDLQYWNARAILSLKFIKIPTGRESDLCIVDQTAGNTHLVVIGKSIGTCSSLKIFSFNFENTSLSSSPKATYLFEEGGEPVRIVVHPSGDDFVCSTTTGCK